MPINNNHIPASYFIYKILWDTLDLLYPPYCGGCGKPGVRWCSHCEQSSERLGENICPICGQPQKNKSECDKCKIGARNFIQLRSWGLFSGSLRNAIHKIKYERDIGLGESLSRKIIDEFLVHSWSVDLITAVPLSKRRMAEKGYNHANLLARPLSLFTGIPFQPTALIRSKELTPQVGHTYLERMENVKEAFESPASQVKDKNVLIIDDVITTTATMQACSESLKKSGAHNIYGLSLARTILYNV